MLIPHVFLVWLSAYLFICLPQDVFLFLISSGEPFHCCSSSCYVPVSLSSIDFFFFSLSFFFFFTLWLKQQPEANFSVKSLFHTHNSNHCILTRHKTVDSDFSNSHETNLSSYSLNCPQILEYEKYMQRRKAPDYVNMNIIWQKPSWHVITCTFKLWHLNTKGEVALSNTAACVRWYACLWTFSR